MQLLMALRASVSELKIMNSIYIIGQCNMSSIAINHLIKSDVYDIKCTSVNEMSNLQPEEPVYVVITINIHYPCDMHEKMDFLCRARKDMWNMRVALILMQHPVAPIFIDWILQASSFEYDYFDSHMGLTFLEKKLSDFFLLHNHENRKYFLKDNKFSRQESVILFYLIQGMSLTLISKNMNINLKTVYCHRKNILDKMRLPGWRELLLYRKTVLMIIRCVCRTRVKHDCVYLGNILRASLVHDIKYEESCDNGR